MCNADNLGNEGPASTPTVATIPLRITATSRRLCRWRRAPRRVGVRTSAGFTLIELLVVIAIIAILAALMLAALGAAIGRAQCASCIANMKQLAAAVHLYADDNENYLPREGADRDGKTKWNTWTKVGSADSYDVWYNALPRNQDLITVSNYAEPPSKSPSFYSDKVMQWMQCPTGVDKIPPKAHKANYPIALFSIAMNSKLIIYGYEPWVKMGDIERVNTSALVLFSDAMVEGEPPVCDGQDTKDLGQPAACGDRFSARHNGGGNIATADGSVAYRKGPKVVETDRAKSHYGRQIMPETDLIWQLRPAPANP